MYQNKSDEKRRLIIFIILTISIAWIIFLQVPVWGLKYGSGNSVLIVAAAMFAPALSNILTRLITREGFQNMCLKPHIKKYWKDYILLYFGPTVLLLLSGGFYFLIFPGSFDRSFSYLNKIAAASSNSGMIPVRLIQIQFLIFILIGPIVNIIPTLGEELGWRGYLLPKLRGLFSDRMALVFTGIIWGFWHTPVIVMGHNYGTEYAGYPWLGILAMIVFCVALGIIEGYFAMKMESVIPAAMIHSTVNAGAAFPVLFAKTGYNPLLGPSITGLIGGLPFIIVAVFLLIRVGKISRKGVRTDLQNGNGGF
jgi:membrane protease YdiL (CAAX protease family)